MLALLTETLPVGVAKFDLSGRIEHANGRLAQLLAPSSPDGLFGRAARGQLDTGDLATAFASLRDGTGSLFVIDHVDAEASPATTNGPFVRSTIRPGP